MGYKGAHSGNTPSNNRMTEFREVVHIPGDGPWSVDASELFRVYESKPPTWSSSPWGHGAQPALRLACRRSVPHSWRLDLGRRGLRPRRHERHHHRLGHRGFGAPPGGVQRSGEGWLAGAEPKQIGGARIERGVCSLP
jgi:hypothetical protein